VPLFLDAPTGDMWRTWFQTFSSVESRTGRTTTREGIEAPAPPVVPAPRRRCLVGRRSVRPPTGEHRAWSSRQQLGPRRRKQPAAASARSETNGLAQCRCSMEPRPEGVPVCSAPQQPAQQCRFSISLAVHALHFQALHDWSGHYCMC
jgi:hypothetical protein